MSSLAELSRPVELAVGSWILVLFLAALMMMVAGAVTEWMEREKE